MALILIKNISCGHIQKLTISPTRDLCCKRINLTEPIICSECNMVYTSNSEYLLHYKQKHNSEEKEKRAMK